MSEFITVITLLFSALDCIDLQAVFDRIPIALPFFHLRSPVFRAKSG